MEGQLTNTNSNFDIEDTPYEPHQSSTSNFLSPHFSNHLSSSPICIEKPYLHCLLDDSSNPRSDEKNNEYVIKYDIYGNSVSRTHLSSPLPYYSHNMSYEFGGNCTNLESPCREMEMFDQEPSEWDMDKENIDPKGAMTTPYKSKRPPNASNNSLTGVSTSGRSILRDITPPVGKKKAVVNCSGIEVNFAILS